MQELKNSRSWTKGSHSMMTMLAIFHQQKQKLLQVSIYLLFSFSVLNTSLIFYQSFLKIFLWIFFMMQMQHRLKERLFTAI